jgi:hypothetical protein
MLVTAHSSSGYCTIVGSECTGEISFTRLILTKPFISSPQHLIIISERDMFDYSAGEPNPDMLTVLRALEVSILLFVSTIVSHVGPLDI